MCDFSFGEKFKVSKTSNEFVELYFYYDSQAWFGCFPILYKDMMIDFSGLSQAELDCMAKKFYSDLHPNNIEKTIDLIERSWPSSTHSETYRVFEGLLSCNWECRSCGAGKVNDQPAARIRDIKKKGYIVATKTFCCSSCGRSQYHDILLPFNIESRVRGELRKPISNRMKERIISVLNKVDVFWDVHKSSGPFVIDHKFPSQRWSEPETDNDKLSDEGIVRKFQLLDNQTNMLKSRKCDQCVNSGERPSFLGVHWFYSGSSKWVASQEEGSGCYGCPWYDIEKWRQELNKKLKKS